MRSHRFALWNGIVRAFIEGVHEVEPTSFVAVMRRRDRVEIEIERIDGRRVVQALPRRDRWWALHPWPIEAMRCEGVRLARSAAQASPGQYATACTLPLPAYVAAMGSGGPRCPADPETMITVWSNGRAQAHLPWPGGTRDITPFSSDARQRVARLALGVD